VRKNSADAEVMDVATVRAKAENFIFIFGLLKLLAVFKIIIIYENVK
jgi:hypothetical protein